jgi:hypothetical protein
MTNLIPFEGTLERNGKKIFTKQGDFLITPRQPSKQSSSKTSVYLLHIDTNGKRRYVSSLWEQAPNVYELEYGRIRYRLTLTDTSAIFTRVDAVRANPHVYHMGLVSKSETEA